MRVRWGLRFLLFAMGFGLAVYGYVPSVEQHAARTSAARIILRPTVPCLPSIGAAQDVMVPTVVSGFGELESLERRFGVEPPHPDRVPTAEEVETFLFELGLSVLEVDCSFYPCASVVVAPEGEELPSLAVVRDELVRAGFAGGIVKSETSGRRDDEGRMHFMPRMVITMAVDLLVDPAHRRFERRMADVVRVRSSDLMSERIEASFP